MLKFSQKCFFLLIVCQFKVTKRIEEKDRKEKIEEQKVDNQTVSVETNKLGDEKCYGLNWI